MQNFCTEVAGNNFAVFDNIRVITGTLGDKAILDHPRIICTSFFGHHLTHRWIEQLHRFDIAPTPTEVVNTDHFDAFFRYRAIGQTRFVLGKQNQCRCSLVRVGKGKITIFRRPPGDL